MVPTLSPELVFEILDHLFPLSLAQYSPAPSPSYAEIKTFCLVSRHWAAYLQYRLFQHVELGAPQDRLSFLRATASRVERADALSRSTRTLVLKGPIFRKDDHGRDVADMFPVCPNLRTVHVRGEMVLSYVPSSSRVLRVFPSIERLDVEQRPSSSWDALYGLLRVLPSLKHLAIRDYSSPGTLLSPLTPSSDSDSPFHFHLREFLLVCPWKRVPADYLSSFLSSSTGSLEVLAISILSEPPIDIETVIAAHAATLRSLGIDVSETLSLPPELIASCTRLQQLVLTGFQPTIFPSLPPTIRRLQFNSPLWPDLNLASSVDASFLRAAIDALPKLPVLENVFVPGYHARDPRVKRKYVGDGWGTVTEGQWAEKYGGLREACGKRGAGVESPFGAENDRWMRFFEFGYEEPVGSGEP